VGEPVFLELNNTSTNCYVLDFSSKHLGLQVEGPGGMSYKYGDPVHTSVRCSNRTRTSAVRCIIARRRSFAFPEPGTYTVTVEAYCRNNSDIDPEPVSNPVSFNVEAPTEPGDLAALELIRTNPREYGLLMYFGGGEHLTEGMAIVLSLAAGSSRYALAGRYVLSLAWSKPVHGLGGGPRRDICLDSALHYSVATTPGCPSALQFLNTVALDRAAMRLGVTSPEVEALVSSKQAADPSFVDLMPLVRDSVRSAYAAERAQLTLSEISAIRSTTVAVERPDPGSVRICAKSSGLGGIRDHFAWESRYVSSDTDFVLRAYP
jgi:hypothetical protein